MTFLLIWPIWAEWGSFPHSILKWESSNHACQHCQWYNFMGRLISVIKDGHFCPIAFCSGVKIYPNKVSQLKLQNPWASFCASLTGKWKGFPLLNKECFAAKLLQFPWTIQGRRENQGSVSCTLSHHLTSLRHVHQPAVHGHLQWSKVVARVTTTCQKNWKTKAKEPHCPA